MTIFCVTVEFATRETNCCLQYRRNQNLGKLLEGVVEFQFNPSSWLKGFFDYSDFEANFNIYVEFLR